MELSNNPYYDSLFYSMIEGVSYEFLFFMTACLFLMLLVAFISFFLDKKVVWLGVGFVLLLGLLSFLIGVLFTVIGMMGAFDAIEAAGDISPSLVAGGVKMAIKSTVIGFCVLIVSIIVSIKIVFLRYFIKMIILK